MKIKLKGQPGRRIIPTINRCLCGNRFPHAFTGAWEMVFRNGQIYARCLKGECRRLAEVFVHAPNRYWIWPVNSELS